MDGRVAFPAKTDQVVERGLPAPAAVDNVVHVDRLAAEDAAVLAYATVTLAGLLIDGTVCLRFRPLLSSFHAGVWLWLMERAHQFTHGAPADDGSPCAGGS